MDEKELVKMYTKFVRMCAGELIRFASTLEKNKDAEINGANKNAAIVGAAIALPSTLIVNAALELEHLFDKKKEDQ